MNLEEGGWWMVFTAVCLASVVGLLEYEGVINLLDESESVEKPLTNTTDEMHPLGKECLTTHDVAMHFHPYLTILIDGEEYLIPADSGIDTETCPQAMHMTHTHDDTGKYMSKDTRLSMCLWRYFSMCGANTSMKQESWNTVMVLLR